MLEFLSANWVWILLIGAMLWMMVGHGGCGGGHQHSTPELRTTQTSVNMSTTGGRAQSPPDPGRSPLYPRGVSHVGFVSSASRTS